MPALTITRRDCFSFLPISAAAAAVFLDTRRADAQPTPATPEQAASSLASFPSQDPALVQQMVGASHGNIARVKELLADAPQLANAAIDWGFGDWETAIGAASHVGNREIAELLMKHGARPDLFTHAMLGHIDVVRAAIAAQPGLQKTTGPHGITLLAHAEAGGDQAKLVVAYLEQLGDADPRITEAPVTDAIKAAIIGEYAMAGSNEGDVLKVFEKDRGLWIQRGDKPRRGLRHLGDAVFTPAGGKDVRLTFVVEGDRAVRLDVTTPKPVVTATRR